MRTIFFTLFALVAALNPAFSQATLVFTTNATLRTVNAGSFDSIPLQVAGGTPSYTFSLPTGQKLPEGLVLDSATGVISGTPVRPTSTTVQVVVRDSGVPVRARSRNFTLNIAADAPILPAIRFDALPQLPQVDQNFSYTFTASKGKPAYTFSNSTTLPAGLTLSPSGVLSGTPLLSAAPQSTVEYKIGIKVTGSNAIPQSSTRTYLLPVRPAAPPVITTKTLPDAEMGQEYFFDDLVVTGGKLPYKFKAAAAFPAELVIAEDGTISGIPKTAGTYRLKISVTDANNRTVTTYVSLIVSDAPAPKITTATPLFWSLNQAIGTTLQATAGRAPYKWAKIGSSTDPLRNLPAGVVLNQNGTFSGAPTAAGTFKVPIRVTDDLGKGSTVTFTIIVSGPLSITSPSPLDPALVGVSVNSTLTAQGGILPYKWTLKNRGTLPATVTLGSTGRLSGTVNATGNFTFTAEVADSRNGTAAVAEKQLTLPVLNYNLLIVTSSLPDGTAGSNYTATPLVATGGRPPYAWSFTPAVGGLSAATGNLSGKPLASGNYTLVLKVTDANAKFVTRNVTLRINEPAPLAFDPLTLPNGRVAATYNATLGAKGGFAPYSYTLKTSGTLPPGLALATNGAITGKPTTAGTYKFFVILKDTKTPAATTIEREFTIVIDPYGMAISGPATITGKQFTTINPAQFPVTGGTANYTWSASPTLPTGLLLNSTTGLVTGNLTAAVGNYTVAIKVTDRNAQSVSRNVTVSITAPDPVVWVTPATLPEGQAGVNYTEVPLAASGGKAPYTYVLKTGSTLPSGLTLSAGKISGMPRVAGTFKFTIIASDSQTPVKSTAEREFTLVIKPAAPLAITAPNPMPAANVGSAYGPASFTASGGLPPYTWSVTPSPPAPGLIFSGGNLTGTPTTVGNYTFTVRVVDSASANTTRTITLPVAASIPLEWVTPETLPGGMVLNTYNATLSTKGGFAPVTITPISGNLSAAGLTQTGARISGTPTLPGNVTFTLQAKDKNGVTANRTFTLPIAAYDLAISADSPSSINGIVNLPLEPVAFNAEGGSEPYVWSIVGTKPAWLAINPSTGVLSGTSNATGNFTVVVSVKDGKQQTANKTCTISIGLGEPPLIDAAQQLPAGMVAVPYPSTAINAEGGIEPYRFSLKIGSSLPQDLTLNATTGVISGTPTTEGNFTTTIVVTGANGASAERAYTIRIDAYDLAVDIPATIPGQANKPLAPVILDATGGLEPYNWSVSPSLPLGLSLNATTGSITGTPTTAGNTTVTFTVKDARQRTATATTKFVIAAADPLEFITAASLPAGKVASVYGGDVTILPMPVPATGITIEGKGGFSPYTYALKIPGTLPPGLTLSTAGKITGTPTTAGTFKFFVVMKDSKNTTAEQEFTIVVAPYGMSIVSDYAGNVIPAKANQPLVADFQVTGGKPIYAWSILGTKPVWLSVNSTTGEFSGTPTAAGNTTVTLQVRDGASQNATANFTISVETADPLYISTPANLGTVNINTAFSTTLQALGGKPAYTWSLASRGTLPANANITAGGVLTANSSTALTANFTVMVRDSAGTNATQAMTLAFRNPSTLSVATDSLPEGRVNDDYSLQLAATGGTNPYEWALTNNSTLPAGLDLALTGWITGKPTAAGNSTLSFQVTDANGAKAIRQLQLVIKPASGDVPPSGKLFTDVTDFVNIPQHSVIAVEDFTNDGREDVLARNDDGTAKLLVAQGAFDLRDGTAQAGLTGATPALVADFNNDGVTDILATNTPRTEATLYLNNGRGVFTKQALTGLLTGDLAGYRQVSYADIDGDGDLDLVFNINATTGGGIAAVFNQANTSQTAAPLFSGKTYLIKTTWKNPSFSVTDANNDGKPDFVAVQTNGNWPNDTHVPHPASLYLNSGNSSADYQNPTGTKTLAGYTEKANCGITASSEFSPIYSFDIDNDGDLDLINGSSDWPSAGSIPRIYINDGTGTYTQKDSPIIHGRYYHHGLTIFDADLDGDQDAVWTSLHTFANIYPRMWENGMTYLKATAGNGTIDPAKAFFDSTTTWGIDAKIPGGGNLGSDGYTADLDADGDLDFVVWANNGWGAGKYFKVYRNDSNLKKANWLKVELVGAISPAQGTGARVELELKDVKSNRPNDLKEISRFDVVLGSFSWTQAKVDAESKGGYLATITSSGERDALFASVGGSDKLKAWGYWLGASDELSEGNWTWITGEKWDYTDWAYASKLGHRNPSGGRSENYLQLLGLSSNSPQSWNDWGDTFLHWNDLSNSHQIGYIIEYNRPTEASASTSTLAQYFGADIGSATKSSLTFGLADKAQAAKVTVYWPSGLKSVLENVAANQVIQIHEIDELPPERPTEEGDVIAWGANPNGETTIPALLNRVVQIVAGDSSSAALKADGTVSVWGTNWAGQRNVPAGLTDIVQIAAGNNHYLALDSQGKVTAWGWNTSNQTTVPATLRRAKAVAAGFNTSYALTGDGRILAWGANDQGQATIPAGLTDVTALAAGCGHVLALKGDGTVVAWGRNDMGQATVPAGLTGVVQIAAGDYHSVALKNDGTVVAWGANWTGQATVPTGLTGVAQISAEGDRSLAFKTDNSIVNWGFNPDNITPPPAPGNVLGIAAGAKHALALVRKIQIAVDGEIPIGTEGYGLDFGLTASGGTGGSYTWSIQGDKPAWLTIDPATGKISGTPSTAGTYSFIVRASSGGRWGEIEVILEVVKPKTGLWVATTGNDTTGDGSLTKPFATINKAHAVALKGDIIKVLPGNYTESVVIEKAVQILSAEGPEKTIIRSASKASAVFAKGEGVNGGKLIGFTLTGGGGLNFPGAFNRYGGGFELAAPAGVNFEVRHCIIRNNSDSGITFGGGLHVTWGATLHLVNSLIHSNAAWANGGAALIEQSNLIADRCTIVSNTNNGFNRIGGISAAGNCNIQIKNSILWNNFHNQYGSFSSGPGGNATFSFSYSIIQGGTTATVGGNTKTIVNTGAGCLSSDPKFAETTTYALGAGSPAIDSGDPAAPKDLDNTRADMGWNPALANYGVLDSDNDGVNDYRELYDGTDPSDPKSFDPLSLGLMAHYPFENTPLDESGFARHLTDRFNATYSSSYDGVGYALKTTSSTGAMTLKKSGIQGNQARTLSAWIKSYGPQPWPQGYFLNIGEGGIIKGDMSTLVISSQYDRGLSFDSPILGMDNNYANFRMEQNAPFYGQWNHVVVSYYDKLANAKIYLNGKVVDIEFTIGYGNPDDILNTNDGGISVSRFIDPTDIDALQGRGFAGLVDNVRIYNRALSAAEVSQLYSEESGEPNMVLVQGGTLPSGSALANQTVSAFHIARFETTWAEWKQVRSWAAANGYDIGTAGQGSADNHPVTNVNWYDAVKWCNAKSQMEGLMPVYSVNGTIYKTDEADPTPLATANGYRLPAEAEWEWAARGGVNSQGYTYSGSNDLNAVGWYQNNTSGTGTKSVGGKGENELGIYDMSGNVAEWCYDKKYWNQFYKRGLLRINKGGSTDFPADWCSITYLIDASTDWWPDNRFSRIGFRYARNAIGDMVTVQGGTLPTGSALANQTVQAFQIGRTEVTWDEWQTVRTWAVANGYTDLAGVGDTYPTGSEGNFPVISLSWFDMVKWSNAKSQMEGLTPVYTVNGTIFRTGQTTPTPNPTANGYRLPYEVEWEWAARGGVSSKGYTYSGSNDINAVAWYWDNSNHGTKAVGTKLSNELGFYDMSGNAWEWCWDVYDPTSFRSGRGGGWANYAGACAVSYRDYTTDDSSLNGGFRLARNIGPKISITGTLPEAMLNQAYAGYTFGAVGSTGDKVWSISEGTLPPGMSFSANGTLSGTPTAADTYTFVIRVESAGYWDEVEVEFEVATPVFVSTIAGSDGGFADGFRQDAKFSNPWGVAVDANGNVFVADKGNHRIRKISPNGVVSTLAGSGNADFQDGQGTSASFNIPMDVAVDSFGNVYVADALNNRIRKVTPDGYVSTLAGSGNESYADGVGSEASFNKPNGIAVDSIGNVYVGDSFNHRIRKITPSGVVSTLAGSGNQDYADGQGVAASFAWPTGVAVDKNGNVYVADSNNLRIRKITPGGYVSTLAGSGLADYIDAQGNNAGFNFPYDVAVDSNGNVYVSEYFINLIRKITPDGLVSTFAGYIDYPLGSNQGYLDGFVSEARFRHPSSICVDTVGNVFVADASNNRIRKIAPNP